MLKLVMNIVSKKGITHFKRWSIIQSKWFNIYIHAIYVADLDKHCHDHPWNFMSIILKGTYIEKVINKHPKHNRYISYLTRSFWSNTFKWNKAETTHKIDKIMDGPVYTLFITGKNRRDWGYDVDGTWYQWEEYHSIKKHL